MIPRLSTRTTLFLVATLLFALTPFYIVSYLLLLAGGVHILRFSTTFRTVVGRTILSFALLAAVIMIVGVLTWAIHIPLYPIIVALAFLLMLFIFSRTKIVDRSSKQIIDRGDIVSLCLSLLIIGFIVVGFYLPKPSSSASFQLLTNGYDNSAHLSLLTTNSDNKGYVYGDLESVKLETITNLNAYPQGWHVATSNIANGMGINFFGTESPGTLKVNAYIFVLMFWYVIALFIATRLMWRLWESMSKKLGKDGTSLDTIIVFALANILIQVLVFWGSLLLGFGSFIGCLVYLILLVTMLVDKEDRGSNIPHMIVASLAAVAVSQTWVLPFPAVIAMLVLGFYTPKALKKISVPTLKKVINNKSFLIRLGLLAIAVIGGLFQIAILLKYSSTSTTAALNNDGGMFWISTILAGVLCIGTLLFWLQTRTSSIASIHNRFLISVAPLIILAAGIFIFQLITAEKTTYYFVKVLGLVVAVIGIFFVPWFTSLVVSFKQRDSIPFSSSIVAICLLALLCISTGQNLLAFSGFVQRNSKVTGEVASQVVNYLEKEDQQSTQLIVLKFDSMGENSDATYAANRLGHRYDLCNNYIFTTKDQTLENQVSRIGKCADTVSNETFFVVVDQKTQPLVEALDKANIRTLLLQ